MIARMSHLHYFKSSIFLLLTVLLSSCAHRSPLYDAINKNNISEMQTILASINDINTIRGSNGSTPLHKAASEGKVEIVRLLLEKGAAVDPLMDGNISPLFQAAYKGHADVVRLLLEHNAEINRVTNNQRTPLHAAAYEGNLDVVEVLLIYGAEVNKIDSDGATPLDWAAYGLHLKVAALLKKHGGQYYKKFY